MGRLGYCFCPCVVSNVGPERKHSFDNIRNSSELDVLFWFFDNNIDRTKDNNFARMLGKAYCQTIALLIYRVVEEAQMMTIKEVKGILDKHEKGIAKLKRAPLKHMKWALRILEYYNIFGLLSHLNFFYYEEAWRIFPTEDSYHFLKMLIADEDIYLCNKLHELTLEYCKQFDVAGAVELVKGLE